MDEIDLIAAYARRLEAALRRAGRPAQPLVDETTAHLAEDAARIARAEGCSEADAARRAIERFGDVRAVVAAARRSGRALAARIARITSLVVFAVATWEIFTLFMNPAMRREDALMVNFLAELGFTAIVVDRALAGGRSAARLMPPILALNGLLAAGLLAAGYWTGAVSQRAAGWHLSSASVLQWADPLWALILVQSIAGLRALGGIRSRDGALVAG